MSNVLQVTEPRPEVCQVQTSSVLWTRLSAFRLEVLETQFDLLRSVCQFVQVDYLSLYEFCEFDFLFSF